ncbi:hypothetical protein AB8Q18_08860 [Neisseriaceae bacterium CLB008]
MFFKKKKPIILQFSDVSQIDNLVAERKSFHIHGIDFENTFDQCTSIEEAIEAAGLTCRIYTKGRIVAAATGIFSMGAGLAALTGIAAHNILTWNPQYEICRDLANGRILVEWKK